MPRNTNEKSSASEHAILNALGLSAELRLRWGKLKEETGLSSRTLSKHLKKLEADKDVRRIVDVNTEKYPPPVYYELVGKAEREFYQGIQDEWKAIGDRLNKIAKLTAGDPDSYLEIVLESILWDIVFTLYHSAKAPRVLFSHGLLGWHSRVHHEMMWKVIEYCAKHKDYKTELQKLYQNLNADISKKEKTKWPK